MPFEARGSGNYASPCISRNVAVCSNDGRIANKNKQSQATKNNTYRWMELPGNSQNDIPKSPVACRRNPIGYLSHPTGLCTFVSH